MKQLWKLGLVLIGCSAVLILLAFALTGGVLQKLSSEKISPKHVTFSPKEVTSLDIRVTTDDVRILGTNEASIRVDYSETGRKTYEIINRGGKLTISEKSSIFQIINLDFGITRQPVTITLPQDLLDRLEVTVDTGDISIEDLTVNGKVILSNSTGQISASSLNILGDLSVKAETGSTHLDGIDAKTMEIQSSTGDVSLRHLNILETLVTHVEMGQMLLDAVDVGRSIKLHSSAGDIKGTLAGQMSDYQILSKTDLGDSNLPKERTGGSRQLEVETEMGSIMIEFAED